MDEELITEFKELFSFDKEKQTSILNRIITDNRRSMRTIFYGFIKLQRKLMRIIQLKYYSPHHLY